MCRLALIEVQLHQVSLLPYLLLQLLKALKNPERKEPKTVRDIPRNISSN
jgi:hypothetical protein